MAEEEKLPVADDASVHKVVEAIAKYVTEHPDASLEQALAAGQASATGGKRTALSERQKEKITRYGVVLVETAWVLFKKSGPEAALFGALDTLLDVGPEGVRINPALRAWVEEKAHSAAEGYLKVARFLGYEQPAIAREHPGHAALVAADARNNALRAYRDAHGGALPPGRAGAVEIASPISIPGSHTRGGCVLNEEYDLLSLPRAMWPEATSPSSEEIECAGDFFRLMGLPRADQRAAFIMHLVHLLSRPGSLTTLALWYDKLSSEGFS